MFALARPLPLSVTEPATGAAGARGSRGLPPPTLTVYAPGVTSRAPSLCTVLIVVQVRAAGLRREIVA